MRGHVARKGKRYYVVVDVGVDEPASASRSGSPGSTQERGRARADRGAQRRRPRDLHRAGRRWIGTCWRSGCQPVPLVSARRPSRPLARRDAANALGQAATRGVDVPADVRAAQDRPGASGSSSSIRDGQRAAGAPRWDAGPPEQRRPAFPPPDRQGWPAVDPVPRLRHTHATLALQAGIHPKIVSERQAPGPPRPVPSAFCTWSSDRSVRIASGQRRVRLGFVGPRS